MTIRSAHKRRPEETLRIPISIGVVRQLDHREAVASKSGGEHQRKRLVDRPSVSDVATSVLQHSVVGIQSEVHPSAKVTRIQLGEIRKVAPEDALGHLTEQTHETESSKWEGGLFAGWRVETECSLCEVLLHIFPPEGGIDKPVTKRIEDTLSLCHLLGTALAPLILLAHLSVFEGCFGCEVVSEVAQPCNPHAIVAEHHLFNFEELQ